MIYLPWFLKKKKNKFNEPQPLYIEIPLPPPLEKKVEEEKEERGVVIIEL